MNRFLTRTVIAGLGLLIAIWLVQGLHYTGGIPGFIVLCLIFGLVNAIIRPILRLLSLPLMILTLGLFSLVINALLLLLTQALAEAVGIRFVIDGFGPALLGAIVISIVSVAAHLFVRD